MSYVTVFVRLLSYFTLAQIIKWNLGIFFPFLKQNFFFLIWNLENVFWQKKLKECQKSWVHTSVKKGQWYYFENKNISKVLAASQKCHKNVLTNFLNIFSDFFIFEVFEINQLKRETLNFKKQCTIVEFKSIFVTSRPFTHLLFLHAILL